MVAHDQLDAAIKIIWRDEWTRALHEDQTISGSSPTMIS